MLVHQGWIYIVVGLVLAVAVATAIPYATRISSGRRLRR
jgi:hypothetical protein